MVSSRRATFPGKLVFMEPKAVLDPAVAGLNVRAKLFHVRPTGTVGRPFFLLISLALRRKEVAIFHHAFAKFLAPRNSWTKFGGVRPTGIVGPRRRKIRQQDGKTKEQRTREKFCFHRILISFF
jgi:hypothetical protein